MLRALEAPIRQIAENSGVEGSIVVSNVLGNKSQTFGFDAQKEEYVDMLSAGILDPAKVVRVTAGRGLDCRPDDHDRAMVAEARRRRRPPRHGRRPMGGMDY